MLLHQTLLHWIALKKTLVTLHLDVELLQEAHRVQVRREAHGSGRVQVEVLRRLTKERNRNNRLRHARKRQLLVVGCARVGYQDTHRHLLCLNLILVQMLELEHGSLVRQVYALLLSLVR